MTKPSSLPMPCLLYGTAWKKEKTADLVSLAVKNGFRGIDTACQPKHYNERGVGEALKRLFCEGISRSDLYVQTKFTPVNGQDPSTIPYDKRASLDEQVAESFVVSKKNLGVDYVDGLILHAPLDNFDQTMIVWQAMEHIYKLGEAKQIGLSNCYELEMLQQLYESASIKPTILQNRFYQATNYDHEIRRWCKEKMVYQSFWTLTANPEILSSEILQTTALRYQRTVVQILFRFLVDSNIVPLTGTSSELHMKEDLAILNFDLPKTVIEEIGVLFKPSVCS